MSKPVTLRFLGDRRALEKDTEAAEKRLQKFGKSMENVGRKMTLGVTLPLAALGVKAFNAASDLGEAVDLATRAFAENADEVKDWAEGAAENMGLAKSEALQAAAQFKLMFDEMGFGQRQATDMSKSLVQLAADMGSAFNEEPIEMLDKLRAGITGEVEPLKRFGVVMNAAAVDAKAMEMGLADANGEISEAAKVQARFAIIMEKTNSVQGNFADTADGAANQARIARARFEDMAAELGEHLLPIGTQVIGMASSLFDAFASLPDGAQKTIVAVAAVAAAVGPLLIVTGKLIQSWKTLKTTATSLHGVLSGRVSPAMLGVGAVLATGVAVWSAFRQEAEANAEVQGRFEDAIRAAGDAVEGTNQAVAESIKQSEDLTDALDAAGVTAGDLSTAVQGNEKDWERFKRQLLDAAGITDTVGQAIHPLNRELDRLRSESKDAKENVEQQNRVLGETADKAGEAGDAAGDAAGEIAGMGEEAGDAGDAVDGLKSALDELIGSALGTEQASLRYKSSVMGLTGELKSNGLTLDDNTKKGIANREAILDAVEAARSHAEAIAEETGSTAEANAVFAEHVTQLRKVLVQSGLTEKQVDQYLRTLNLTPGRIDTHVAADTDGAEREILGVSNAMAALHGKRATVRVDVKAGSVSRALETLILEGRAHGGPVPGPRSKPVPMMLHGGEFVLSADVVDAIKRGGSTRGLGASGGAAGDGGHGFAPEITVYAGAGVDGDELGRKIVDALKEYERRNGKGWRN